MKVKSRGAQKAQRQNLMLKINNYRGAIYAKKFR
jgi:hypothetical protein